jgi:hypothetical protein
MPTALRREQRRSALLHPELMAQLGLADSDRAPPNGVS